MVQGALACSRCILFSIENCQIKHCALAARATTSAMTSPAQWQASGGGQAATQTRGGSGRAGDVREGAAAAEAESEALRETPEPSDEGAQQDAAGAAGLLRVDDATPSVAASPRAAEGVASEAGEG